MSSSSNSLPQFVIHPPLTSNDDGKPTESLAKDAQRVWALIQDERHLTADALLQSVRQRIDAIKQESSKSQKNGRFRNKKSSSDCDSEVHQATELLQKHQADIEKLQHRCRIFRNAQRNLEINDDWTHASTHFGIVTYYRREPDESLSIKLEGELKDVPLFEQVCVLKEVDLHYKWAPFCSSSMTVADLDKLDTVGWFLIGLPHFGLARDGCFRAIGCDNTREDGSILLAGQGIRDQKPAEPEPEDTYLSNDPVLDLLDIPPVPTRRGAGRMTIRKFEAIIHVTSPTSARTRLVANVDPNMAFLPQALLEFVMKHLAGVILGKMQQAAKKILRNPITNEHARYMRANRAFYQNWLMPKFQAVCDLHGWEMPKVLAFELTEEQQMDEQRAVDDKELRRAVSLPIPNHDMGESQHSSQSEPANPDTNSDEDEVSALTSRSTRSAWSNNPISSFLREMEERTQRQKAAAVNEARLRAAQRLRPKEFPLDKRQRLDQLKAAKARHIMGLTRDDSTTLSQRITASFYRHGFLMRIFMVSSLATLLFALLHPKSLMQVTPVFIHWDGYRTLIDDIFMILYMCACAVVHFALCDITLVYAFDSLELGRKTGSQIKRFYSDNVRVAVAIASFGIYAISVTKALTRVLFRAFLWYTALVIQIIWEGIVSHGQALFYPFQGLFQLLTIVLRFITLAATQISNVVHSLLIHSNIAGRVMSDLVNIVISALDATFTFAWNFVDHSIAEYDGRVEVTPWRLEAFNTAKMLFSYSAVFLVTVLILFSLSAKSSRKAFEESLPSETSSNTAVSNPKKYTYVSQISSLNQADESKPSNYRSNYPPVPEDREVEMSIITNNLATQKDTVSEVSAVSSIRRRGRLRFRQKNTQSELRTNPDNTRRPNLKHATTR